MTAMPGNQLPRKAVAEAEIQKQRWQSHGAVVMQCREFHELLPRLLKPEGIYSYFNGLAADNAFFHAVYCNIAKAELAQLGLEAEFVPLPIDCSSPEVWKGVR